MTQRVKPHLEADLSAVCGTLILEHANGKESRCFWLRTWVIQWRYKAHWDRDVLCRAILFWHGREGLRVFWEPVGDPFLDERAGRGEGAAP